MSAPREKSILKKSKRRGNPISFDETQFVDFVTSAHQRKMQRKRYGQRLWAEKARQEKLEERREARKGGHELLEKHYGRVLLDEDGRVTTTKYLEITGQLDKKSKPKRSTKPSDAQSKLSLYSFNQTAGGDDDDENDADDHFEESSGDNDEQDLSIIAFEDDEASVVVETTDLHGQKLQNAPSGKKKTRRGGRLARKRRGIVSESESSEDESDGTGRPKGFVYIASSGDDDDSDSDDDDASDETDALDQDYEDGNEEDEEQEYILDDDQDELDEEISSSSLEIDENSDEIDDITESQDADDDMEDASDHWEVLEEVIYDQDGDKDEYHQSTQPKRKLTEQPQKPTTQDDTSRNDEVTQTAKKAKRPITAKEAERDAQLARSIAGSLIEDYLDHTGARTLPLAYADTLFALPKPQVWQEEEERRNALAFEIQRNPQLKGLSQAELQLITDPQEARRLALRRGKNKKTLESLTALQHDTSYGWEEGDGTTDKDFGDIMGIPPACMGGRHRNKPLSKKKKDQSSRARKDRKSSRRRQGEELEIQQSFEAGFEQQATHIDDFDERPKRRGKFTKMKEAKRKNALDRRQKLGGIVPGKYYEGHREGTVSL